MPRSDWHGGKEEAKAKREMGRNGKLGPQNRKEGEENSISGLKSRGNEIAMT